MPLVPYAVAFKLVTVSGLVTMPLRGVVHGPACSGCATRVRRCSPSATLPFIFDFDERFRIIGGNAASTLAGEFSFSISLTICLVYLGVVARGLETGRYRAGSAPCCSRWSMLNHLIPAMFAVVATSLLGLWRLALDTRKPAGVAIVVGFVATVIGGAWAGYRARSRRAGRAARCCARSVPWSWWRGGPNRPGGPTLLGSRRPGIVGALLTGFWSLPVRAQPRLLQRHGLGARSSTTART